jgi:hypothetical protein
MVETPNVNAFCGSNFGSRLVKFTIAHQHETGVAGTKSNSFYMVTSDVEAVLS